MKQQKKLLCFLFTHNVTLLPAKPYATKWVGLVDSNGGGGGKGNIKCLVSFFEQIVNPAQKIVVNSHARE